MATAILINIDGTTRDVHMPEEGSTLAVTRGAIGCGMVEVVRLTEQLDMWVDEEGLFTQPVNALATVVARRYGYIYQAYHGPALITGVTEEGNTVNLTEDQAHAVRAQLAEYTG